VKETFTYRCVVRQFQVGVETLLWISRPFRVYTDKNTKAIYSINQSINQSWIYIAHKRKASNTSLLLR